MGGGLAVSDVREPPRTLGGILRTLGPGLILAGSIVGSGELIAATQTGARAGFIFLGLIIFGCVIKVFVQVEIARYAISSGKTSLEAFNEAPGPRVGFKWGGRQVMANWIVLFWILTMMAGLGQLGGIVGGVGQAMAISVPLTSEGRAYNRAAEARAQLRVLEKQSAEETGQMQDLRRRISGFDFEKKPQDDKWWALLLAGLASFILVRGGFGFIETFATVLVASFTLVTIANLFALQSHEAWAIHGVNLREGLGLSFLTSGEDKLGLALATFGIIGVGASEIVAYPYWCLEKGYGRWTGRPDGSESWVRRARGWVRVLQWDAWASMVIYTFCTVVFYLLGAAVLSRLGLVPEKADLIRTLSAMYLPVFGGWAQAIFLFGAFAVLFSTFFISNAGKARMFTDVVGVAGFVKLDESTRRKGVRWLGGLLPVICALVYIVWPNPARLVIFSGLMQSLLLPMLGFGILWFRCRRTDLRLAPGPVWDFFLCVSFISFLAIGFYLAWSRLGKLMS
ncbi:MAG: transmembrane Mn(2+) transporter [Verrucomicrobiales bacterium]|nr:transmembrane Mn(2+) transporter [Verrucomicrobiales bacterium]